jgi:hypothetical protein
MAERIITTIPTAPVAGVNEVQTLTASAALTAGTFRLRYRNERTSVLNYNATATQIRDALRALNEITADGVSGATGGPVNAVATPVAVTFGGHLARANVPQLVLDSANLTGGTINITTTTAGVDAAVRGMGKGTIVQAEDTGKLYVNEGDVTTPVWRMVTTA